MPGFDTHLLLTQERTPQHTDTLADHADVKLVLPLEPVDDFLECRVARELEAIPERPLDLSILALLGSDRLREAKEGQGKIHKAVLVGFECLLSIDDLRGFACS